MLAPLRGFGSPALDAVQPMPFPVQQSMLDASFPDGNHNYWKSSMHRELSDEAIRSIVDQASVMTSPMSAVVGEYYGGAAGRVGNTETAFPHRQVPWDIVVVAQWTQPRRLRHIRHGRVVWSRRSLLMQAAATSWACWTPMKGRIRRSGRICSVWPQSRDNTIPRTSFV